MKTKNNIDVNLVIDYQSGNQKAMAKLVERWHLIFCKKAYWVVKDAALSKDIVQDSWQTIMDKLHTLQTPSSFTTWALRIVYTKSIDAKRKQQITIKNNNNYKREVVNKTENENDLSHLKSELLKQIKKLPERQQVVLKLFYTEAYSLNEISEILKVSVGTVKSRLFHAREKLKLILKDNNYEN